MKNHFLLLTRSRTGSLALLLALALPQALTARKFYDDDPLWKDPSPRRVGDVARRKINDYYDFFVNTFAHPGERHAPGRAVPAQGVNTLGEVPDSGWYTRRHYYQPMTTEELARGPGGGSAPSMDGPWKVIAAKTEGVTPGFTIADARGRRYILKFDPLSNPEIATAADVVVSKFFHALGYWVPENYIVSFGRDQLVLGENVTVEDDQGRERRMTSRDVTEILLRVPRSPDGRYRGVASLFLSGKLVGPFRYYGTRRDDPNDVVLHEHRRDMRGLSVFCAWVNHDDSRSINTLDAVVEEGGVPHLRHYLVDFGSTLGSASTGVNSPRGGHDYLFDWKPATAQFFTLGLAAPYWARAKYPDFPAVGRFESKIFDPEKWVPEYPNPAFLNRLPDDAFWAAKQVMAFTDEQIRAIVKTGQYTNPRAEQWIADALIERRDKIGKAFFARVLPLDKFAVDADRLVFADLGAEHKLFPPRTYSVRWSRFDNDAETKAPIDGASSFALPDVWRQAAEGSYFAADLEGGEPGKAVTVYLRKRSGEMQVVGVERNWPR